MALFENIKNLFARRRFSYIELFDPLESVLNMDATELYRTQPHLRTVVTFLARNLAQLPLQTFKRIDTVDRKRIIDDPLAKLISRPNNHSTFYEVIYGLICDFKLHDFAVLSLFPSNKTQSGWRLDNIPVSWILESGGGSVWSPEWIRICPPDGTGSSVILQNVEDEPNQFIIFHGYNPINPVAGVSPIRALKDVLSEQIQAWKYRQQSWKRGGRVGAYIERPQGVEWSQEAKQKFARDWKENYSGDGRNAGGTPILEDGMKLHRLGFSAREDEWAEVAKLSLATVANIYHVSPTMVGILDNANYSNVREFHQMLYTDTLGPDIAMIEQRLNAFLVPFVAKDKDLYVEFNLSAKLAGSFEEQAQIISTSVGRPWMTANEARAKFNLPALKGDADRLVTPLNVLVGGQASPRDAGTQNLRSFAPITKSRPIKVKAQMKQTDADDIEKVMEVFFEKQAKEVLPKIPKAKGRKWKKTKADDWFDIERWNEELTAKLEKLVKKITVEVSAEKLEEAGISPDVYNLDTAENFLHAVAQKRANLINQATLREIKEALNEDYSEEAERGTPEGVFEYAKTSRAKEIGVTIATTVAAFAVVDAFRSLRNKKRTKTWIVTSNNPRPTHAAMNSETVDIDERFSNGAKWPGDIALDVSEIAECKCTVEVTIE